MVKRCLVILVLVALLTQLFPGHLLPTDRAAAQEPAPGSKISSLLALQVQAKRQAVKAGGLAAAANATQQAGLFNALQTQGMRLEDISKQQVFIHLAQPLTQSQVAELKTDNITLNLDSWLPPVGSHPTGFVFASIPVDKLEALAEKGYVVRLETAEMLLEPHNDLGTQKINAPAVWAAGYNGTGVRIAVLDSGLDLTHGDIPTPVAKKDYSNYPTLDDTIANIVTGHGTHVAGSVLGRGTRSGGVYRGSAPAADLIFLKIGRDSDSRAPTAAMVNAIKAATDNYSADIITMSYGGWDTYHDGTSETAQAVDYAVSRGAVVLVSAGNDGAANKHYSSTVAASSTTGFIQINVTGAGSGDTTLWFNMVWFDGTGISNSLNMQFYDQGQNPIPTINEAQTQSSRGTEARMGYIGPSQGSHFALPSGNTTNYVKVTNNSGVPQEFHLYEVRGTSAGLVTFQVADPNFTISSPADADNAIAVGAYVTRTSWTNYKGLGPYGYGHTLDSLAPFSSRGPRVDAGAPGKPNIVAPGSAIISARDNVVFPTNVSPTPSYDPAIIDNDGLNLNGSGPADYFVMQGTSMATPLAAGVAALILQKNPAWTPAQVKNVLEFTATDNGTPGWDSTYGWGLINALAALTLPSKIVFVSDRDGNLEIYNMNADSSNQTRLTNNSAYDNMPFPSPDGSQIAFVSGRDGNREIYVMSANGTAQTRLTITSNISNEWPFWSPDGTKIAFASNRDGNPEIYVMNANGDNQTRLTNNPKADDFPVWSPDGSKIAFASNRDGDFAEIYVMNANGDNQTRLTNNPARDNFPFWSPDGTKLTFGSNRGGNWEIYNMNANGDNQTRLTNTPGYDNWQPVGLYGAPKIVFTSNRDGNAEIYVMDRNGANQTRLTNNPPYGDWSRGKWVVPTVTTNNATNITTNSAVLSGNLTGKGSSGYVNLSFDWGTTSGNYTNSTTPVSVNVTGAFSANLTGLSANTTHYFRVKAGGDGIGYGVENTFTTTSTPPGLPDLIIIDKHEVWVQEGASYKVAFTIRNTGNATAPAGHDVHLEVDGAIVETREVPVTLAPGATYSDNFTTVITLTGSWDGVVIYADVNGEVAESNEWNNRRGNTFAWPQAPDLNVIKFETWVVQGQSYRVYYTVRNIGNAPAAAGHDVRLEVDGVVIETQAVPVTLNPLQSYSGNFTTTANLTGGMDKVKVVADINNEVAESREDNNSYLNTFAWPEAPDLVVWNKSERWVAGQSGNYTVSYTLRNIGNAPAPAGHHAHLEVDGTLKEMKAVPLELPPHQTYRDTFNTVITISGGSDNITVIADAHNNVTESDETNNSRTNTLLTVTPAATVEVNNGNRIILAPGQILSVSGTTGIPIAVKNLPNLGAPTNGLAGFTFDFSWNKNIIRVDSAAAATAATGAGWSIIPGTPNNTTGTLTSTGFTTTYSTADVILLYLGLTAVGSLGDNTTITVTIASLGDKTGSPIPASPVNAPVQIIGMLAETSLTQGLSANATGVVVARVNINRIKNPTDNTTANITGGIGSYSATVSGNPSNAIQFLTVYGVSPFDGPSFNATTGVFAVANVTSPIQPNNTTLAEVVPILTGNITTSVTLTVAFQTIGAAGQPGLNVPEEGVNSITLRRGNVKEDALVDIFDALFIAQYIVGQRTLSGINALNAASVKHDGAGGDKIDIFDALFIAQYIVGQRNAYFQ